MLFNSYIFIFIFLPVSLLGYFILNHFQRYYAAKVFLTGMSLWFYSYFHISYLGIILSSIALNYLCHRLMLRTPHAKSVLVGGILGNVGILFYFKYFNFFLNNLNYLFGQNISWAEVLLPLGISFFTFQQIAFLADTYRGDIKEQPFMDYALFVSFFPQLVAGPIVNHAEMLPQFKDHSKKRFSFENFYRGTRVFVLGLAKKVLLADTFGQAVDWGFLNYTTLDSLNTFLVIVFYTLQLYLDFSGYCDMARGLGYMFNIDIPANFLSPYKATNMVDFWNRWHITLTRFFTRYIYIPLGGNRKGTLRTYLNIFIVFLISGIWHGAGWTYILWGCLHGILNILTRLWHRLKEHLHIKATKLGHCFSVLCTFSCTAILWTFFRSTSLEQAFYMLKNLFHFQSAGSVAVNISEAFQLSEIFYIMKVFSLDTLPFGACYCMILFIIIAVIIIFFCKNLYSTEKTHKATALSTLSISVLFVWCVLSLSGVSSFLYFNF